MGFLSHLEPVTIEIKRGVTKMKKMQIATLTTALLMTASAFEPARAWTSIGEWGSNEVTMRASSVSFPSGNSYRTALGTVEDRFYNNPSEMWFDQDYNDSSVSFNNNQSEVWFSSNSDYDPAVTFPYYNWWTGDLDEADVVFYNGEDYTTSMNKTSLWPFDGSYRPFQTTAIHEYGHAAGLGHEDDEYNIMGQDWDHIHCNGSTARSYVGEDACDGLVDIYGRASGGSFEDVSASLFEWSGRSGEYSKHSFCDVYTSGGSLLSSYSTYNGQRRYNVSKGTTYKFEFTFENNGETTQEFRAGYYLSTNNYISTSDDLLATTTFTLSRDNVYTYKRSITIPSDLSSGSTYYLGVKVDDDYSVSEVDGSNNVAYHIIKIN